MLDPCPGGACAGAPDYSFTFRVTRLPDVRTDFLSTLGAAVRASGARSETEAIFAGLRSLRAPHPRRVEFGRGQSARREVSMAAAVRCASFRPRRVVARGAGRAAHRGWLGPDSEGVADAEPGAPDRAVVEVGLEQVVGVAEHAVGQRRR